MIKVVCRAFCALTILFSAGCEEHPNDDLDNYCRSLRESESVTYEIDWITLNNTFCGSTDGMNLDTLSYAMHEIRLHYDVSIYAEFNDGRGAEVIDGFQGCLEVDAQFESQIESFIITTNHDINEEYQKQDTINDILEVRLGINCDTDSDYMDLMEYLSASTVPDLSLAMRLKYDTKPELLDSLSVNVDVLFENGEAYRGTTPVSVIIE